MALRVRWIVSMVHPGINPVRLRVSLQPKDFDDSVPYRLPLERLDYRHALQMLCLPAVQVVNHIPQFLNVRHTVAPTKSATLQNDCSTPAAMAGLQRMYLL